MDELAARRQARRHGIRHLAGSRRRETSPDGDPGDIGVIVADLSQIRGMSGEVMSEALALGDEGLISVIAWMALAADEAHKAAVAAGGRTM